MEFIQGNAFSLDLREFDGVICDPPFNRSTATNCPVEGRLGEVEFSNVAMLQLADRATKPDAFLVVFANFANGAELLVESKATAWTWVATQVWDKRPTRTWVSWGRPLKCVEYVLFFLKGKRKLSFKDGTVATPRCCGTMTVRRRKAVDATSTRTERVIPAPSTR